MQCKYKCQNCGHRWKGYRIDPQTGKKDLILGGVGATLCPECRGDKIDWTNYEAYGEWYRKKINDGGCGGTYEDN